MTQAHINDIIVLTFIAQAESGSDMEIHYVSYNHKYKFGYELNLPVKFQEHTVYFMFLLKTPIEIIEKGNKKKVETGTLALYTPDFNHSIKICDSEYIIDCIAFDMTDDEREFLDSLDIPMNHFFNISSYEFITDIIHKIAYVFHDSFILYRNKGLNPLMQLLFLKTSQMLHVPIPLSNNNKINKEKYINLMNIRNEIYCNPSEEYSIDKMAEKAYMSKSHLQRTYKKIFGVSISQDIIKSRLNHSKYYISCTDMTIKKIAEICGFNSDIYFMRSFKKHFGITPTEYRNSIC